MREAEALRRVLRRGSGKQVRSADERGVAKATALAWFNKHRLLLEPIVGEDILHEVDSQYRELLKATDREATRKSYDTLLAGLKPQLSDVRSRYVAAGPRKVTPTMVSESPPEFSNLVGEPKMQAALERRWEECKRCLAAGAPLAATVMMGGLLEALLLARINRESDKGPIFKAKASPRDKATGQTLALKEWTLKNYIDVAHEVGWVSQSARDVGEVLRDYRNYIHPYKELSHGTVLTVDDAALLWNVSTSIAKQVLR